MSIKFDPIDSLIVIPTRLYGDKGKTIARLALDTGATFSLINWDIAILLGYDPAVSQERIRITTGSGVEFTSKIQVEKLRSWEEHWRIFRYFAIHYRLLHLLMEFLGLIFFVECI